MATLHTVAKVLDIMRTVHNYILTGRDGNTLAERLATPGAAVEAIKNKAS
jgi:hypothetical protein